MKLLYLKFKAVESKLDIDMIVFYLKNAEDNSIIFMVRINNISYLEVHFKTTTTMVTTKFKMNFIFNEWIINEYIASKKKGKLLKLKVIHWWCLLIPHYSEDLQLFKWHQFPAFTYSMMHICIHNLLFSLSILKISLLQRH